MNLLSVPDKCELAFMRYIESLNTPELRGFEVVSSKRHANLPMPHVVVAVTEDTRERLYGRGVFDVPLDIYVASASDDDTQADAHMLAAGAIIAHLNDKAAVGAQINPGATRDANRQAVKDFFFYDYSMRGGQTRAIESGSWETVIRINVVCQGKDA